MTIELKPFDAADYLGDDEAIAAYLESALEDGDGADFAAALGVVARAKGMTEIARKSGMTRPSLYKSLSDAGRPEFATVQHVLRSLGLRLRIAPVEKVGGESAPSERIA